MDQQLQPLIRWAGSKRQLLSRIISRMPQNYGRYIEPFAGSACLFFAITPQNSILADLNSELIETYKILTKHPIRVLRLASAAISSAENYYRLRDADPSLLSPLNRAARFIYLNRFCFNALYRTNKNGKFNVPIGTRTGSFPSESTFRASAQALSKARLCCLDFEATLKLARKGDFVYLDPPYVRRKGADKHVYGCGSFSEEDLPRLIRNLEDLHRGQVNFLLSYSHSEELLSLLGRKQRDSFYVRRNISGKTSGRVPAREVLLNNSDIFGP